jgi:HSP20 family protein
MELKNLLTPWNWFKKEEEQQAIRPQKFARNISAHHPLTRLHHEIDQLFGQFFQGSLLGSDSLPEVRHWGNEVFPQLNIGENKKDYTITVEVPGVEEKDIELTVEDRTLTIRGEKRSKEEDHDHQYHRIERTYGAFQRVLSLPTFANEDQITAAFKNGVLTVMVGRNPQITARGRKIAIT